MLALPFIPEVYRGVKNYVSYITRTSFLPETSNDSRRTKSLMMKNHLSKIGMVVLLIIFTKCHHHHYDDDVVTNHDCPTGQLETPKLLSPDDSITLDFPRWTTLIWSSVPGASSYFVEIEFQDIIHNSYSDSNGAEESFVTTEPALYFQGVGKQFHRWRVVALGTDKCTQSDTTVWRYIYYKN